MKYRRSNERIRASELRVIGSDGAQLGVMVPAEALRLAREQGLDLVEVSPESTPPVCRIMDFNKFRYDENRQERQAKHKHHIAKLKEVKFKPRIEEHDYQVKLLMLKRFLTRGDQAKVTMVYRGREMAHRELGERVLNRLAVDLKAISRVEHTPSLEGRFLTMVFGPDRDGIRRAEREAARKKALEARAAAERRGASAEGSGASRKAAPASPESARGTRRGGTPGDAEAQDA